MHKLLTFQGRDRRLRFWMIQIGALIIPWLVFVALYLGMSLSVGGGLVSNISLWLIIALWVVFYVGLLWITSASCVRRLHDLNLSGWWLLAYLGAIFAAGLVNEGFAGIVYIIMLLHLGCFGGTPGRNRFNTDRDARFPSDDVQPHAA